MRCGNINAHTDLAEVMGELLFIFNDMSKTSLESEVYSKVGQTSRNLRGNVQTINTRRKAYHEEKDKILKNRERGMVGKYRKEGMKKRNTVRNEGRKGKKEGYKTKHTAWRMSFEERSTTFLFMAHSSSHSMIAFWRHTETAILPPTYPYKTPFQCKTWQNEINEWMKKRQTLKYIGAISPSSRGSGIHSRTMCCLLRGFMCVSMNTQSSSWDSNIRTKVRRNSWGKQSGPEVNSVKFLLLLFTVNTENESNIWFWLHISEHQSSQGCRLPAFLTRHPHPIRWQNSGAGEDRWDNGPQPSTLLQVGWGIPGH